MIWWLVGLSGWLAMVVLIVAVLTAAKRGDQQLQRAAMFTGAQAPPHAQAEHEPLDLAAIGGGLGRPVTGIVVALREPRAAGQVIAVRADGDAAPLAGRVLPPDDFLTARVALTGRGESRAHVAAVPLRRGEGALGVTVARDHAPLGRRELDRLARTAAALSLPPTPSHPPHQRPAI